MQNKYKGDNIFQIYTEKILRSSNYINKEFKEVVHFQIKTL